MAGVLRAFLTPDLKSQIECFVAHLLVTPGRQLDVVELKLFLVQRRFLADTVEFPGSDVTEVLVVTLGFTFTKVSVFHFRIVLRILVLFAEVTAARFFTIQSVVGEQFSKLNEVCNASRRFEALVEAFAGSRNMQV